MQRDVGQTGAILDYGIDVSAEPDLDVSPDG
jgi:hypothetical protein